MTLWIPFAAYAGITVIGPAARGALNATGFGMHALIALGVPLVMTLAWIALRRRTSRPRSPEPGARIMFAARRRPGRIGRYIVRRRSLV